MSVAAYTPVICNIPVSAHHYIYDSVTGKPDRQKTLVQLPGMVPKGTLTAFVAPRKSLLRKYIPTQDGASRVDRIKKGSDTKANPMFANPRRMRREPDAIAEVFFNIDRYRPTIKNINKDKGFSFNPDSVTAILPLAEQTEIRWGNNLHIAFAVYDTTEVAIPKENPPLYALPGDMIYCVMHDDASITLHSHPVGGAASWQLGCAINSIHHADYITGDPHCTIALRPART